MCCFFDLNSIFVQRFWTFPDSDIAKTFTCSKDKTGYVTKFGLAPYFKQQLVDGVNKAGQFVLMFDESFNQSTKNKQLDIHVRYWEDDRFQSRYLGSQFLGHSRAHDLLHHIKVSVSPSNSFYRYLYGVLVWVCVGVVVCWGTDLTSFL